MQEIVIYWLKTATVTAVFYLFFKVLLSRETFHRLNRAVLLATAVVSFVLPLCVITIERTVTVEMLESASISTSPIESAVKIQEGSFVWQIGAVVGLVGALAVMVWTLCSMLAIHRLISSAQEVEQNGRERIYVTNKAITPFSWFGNIVLSSEDWQDSARIILAHERAHIRLHHSIDLLVVNLCCAAQWFNPAMWLLRRDLREIHEYEADEAVLMGGVNAREYQLLLIKKAVGNKSYSIANSLNHSTLKNRITMMLQKKSTRASRMRVLYVLPLVCLSLTAFAQTETKVVIADKVTENSSENQISSNLKLNLIEKLPKFNGKDLGAFGEWVGMCVAQHQKTNPTIFGEVCMQFTVEADGTVDKDKIVVLKDSKESEWLSNIVKDVISLSSGMWTPAEENGKPVAVQYALPVRVEKPDDTVTIHFSDNFGKTHIKSANGAIYFVDKKVCEDIKTIDPNQIESVTVYKAATDNEELLKLLASGGFTIEDVAERGCVIITLKK